MLQAIHTLPLRLATYDRLANRSLLTQIRRLAAPLRGLRVVHINSTPHGGGVAEMLHSLVPLSRDVGLDAAWYTLPPDGKFFAVTRQLHNWLQGHPGDLTRHHQRTYSAYLQRVAADMRKLAADVWIIHDPQPLPLPQLVPLSAPVLWRCHIDPLTHKNRPLRLTRIRRTLTRLGIDPQRPLLTQVSRLDPWKRRSVREGFGLGVRRGRAAQRSVQRRFLLPRLLLDDLTQYQELVGSGSRVPEAA